MKTKLLAMILLAGGSMFAQTRFSFGINVGGNARGYHQPAVPSYRGGYQVVPRYEQPRYDNRYSEQSRFQSRSFDRDGDRDDRGRGYEQDYRVNRFRGR